MRRAFAAAAAFAVTALLAVGGAAAHPGQHGPTEGHLLGTGEWGKIDFVGQVTVHDVQSDLIADVTAFGNYAYLARWGGEECAGPETGGQTSPEGGVYVIDISDPSNPREVGFIATHQDTLVGEGMQVIHIDTPKFTGDVLLMNHEQCGKNGKGGVSLWDVTNPLKPKKLHEHFGDITIDGQRDVPDVNQTHSAFMWDAGDRAYLVATDDEEATDVDIFDITNPKKPVLIAELDLNEFNVAQPDIGLIDSFLHDMVVKQIGGRYIMLLSYWDGGYILLDVTDPRNPVFLGDTDFTNPDPELLEQTGIALTPEGNAHQAEFTADNRFVIGTDEDFAPQRPFVSTDDAAGEFEGRFGTPAPAIPSGGTITGVTVFVGRACPGDAAVPPAPNVGTAQIAVVERGVCLFTEKLQAIEAAGGYEAVIIMNREGTGNSCRTVFVPSVQAGIPVVLVGRDTGLALFDRPYNEAACLDANVQLAPIAVGETGDTVTIRSVFDGWGYVHLFGVSGGVLTELDTFAIPEAMDPAFESGFGDLTVHEVATDPTDPSLAYLSYYSGGLRAIQIQCSNPADTSTCELVEVGGYLDAAGNDFWGVEVVADPQNPGGVLILASDRDSGLWIFRDP